MVWDEHAGRAWLERFVKIFKVTKTHPFRPAPSEAWTEIESGISTSSRMIFSKFILFFFQQQWRRCPVPTTLSIPSLVAPIRIARIA
jgi:hypothetical protein